MTPTLLLTVIFTVLGICFFVWLGWKERKDIHTLTGFFLAPSPPHRWQIVATLAATNTALALTVFWFSFLGWQYGIGAAFWIFIYWIVGLEVWARFTRRNTDYPGQSLNSTEPRFQTLHEYISSQLSGNGARRLLAITSILTFLLMVNVELTRGTNVFRILTSEQPSQMAEIIGLILVLSAAVYAAVGGFKAVVNTDVYQWGFACVGMLIALVYCLINLPNSWASLGPIWASSPNFTFGDFFLLPRGLFFILGSLFSWGFWFLVTMDMWQRGASARTLQMVTASSRKALYPWFAFVSLTSVLIGVTVRSLDGNQFHPFPAVRFLEIALQSFASLPFFGPIFFALLFLGFISAMVSTLDTYILVIVHSVFRDLPPNESRAMWTQQPLRKFVVGIATVGIALAGYPIFLLLSRSTFDINALLYIATSLPFVLLPAVLLFKFNALQRELAVTVGVLVGWVGTTVFVFWALSGIHANYSNPSELEFWYNMMYMAPMAASICAFMGHLVSYAVSSLILTQTKGNQ